MGVRACEGASNAANESPFEEGPRGTEGTGHAGIWEEAPAEGSGVGARMTRPSSTTPAKWQDACPKPAQTLLAVTSRPSALSQTSPPSPAAHHAQPPDTKALSRAVSSSSWNPAVPVLLRTCPALALEQPALRAHESGDSGRVGAGPGAPRTGMALTPGCSPGQKLTSCPSCLLTSGPHPGGWGTGYHGGLLGLGAGGQQ